MARVLDAPTTPQKRNSNSSSPSAFSRIRAITRMAVEPFKGTTARQNAGRSLDSDESGVDANSDDHLPATPSPQERTQRPHRSMDPFSETLMEPTMAPHHAVLAPQSLHQNQSETFQKGSSTRLSRPKILEPKHNLSATSGLSTDTQIRPPADISNFDSGNGAKNADLGYSAIPEPSAPIPRTNNKSKGHSEVADSASHPIGPLQGRQN